MTIEEMRKRKKELGLTNQMISERTRIPLGTVQKIFAGVTRNPHRSAMMLLEEMFAFDFGPNSYLDCLDGGSGDCLLEEAAPEYKAIQNDPKQGYYTLDDYYKLPDERRVELIDGVIYDMSAPSAGHQMVLGELYIQFHGCVAAHPECELYFAPCDVHLDRDNRTMVQPDLFIVCHNDQITYRRIEGAPDFVLEIVSPSSDLHDRFRKLNKYKFAGVREYWIVDPEKYEITVHDFEHDARPEYYSFADKVDVRISDGKCSIDFSPIYTKVKRMKEAEKKAEGLEI